MGLRLAQLEEGVKLSRSTDDWRASVNEVLAGVTAATRLGRPDDLRAALAILAERGRARMEEDGRRRSVAINPALLDGRE